MSDFANSTGGAPQGEPRQNPTRPSSGPALVYLADALEEFKDEIATTGQTLPFDTNEAAVTIKQDGEKLFFALEHQQTLISLEVIDREGTLLPDQPVYADSSWNISRSSIAENAILRANFGDATVQMPPHP